MFQMNKLDFQFYSFAVSNSNLELYNAKQAEINSYLERGEKVPPMLLNIYFMLQFPVDYVTGIENREKVAAATKKAREYFENNGYKEYQFEGLKKSKDGAKDVFIAYSTNDMFFYCATNYFGLLSGGGIKEVKDDVIRFFYDQVLQYRNKYFSEKHKVHCDHYKIAVFAACLTIAVGLKISNKTKITNYELFQSSKNALKKIQTDFSK
jgi:hypothetical protein